MDAIAKILRCFVVVKAVIFYYWKHTEGDSRDLRTSIENIQCIVSRLTGLKIEKFVVEFEGDAVRANVERYPDKAIIYVRESQTEEEQRFAVVKELVQTLADEPTDYSTDVVGTIRGLVKSKGGGMLDPQAAAEIQSEHFAEIMALELLYPFEYRDQDGAAIANGKSVHEIATLRGVPPYWIERALRKHYLRLCRSVWQALPVDIQYPPLPEPGSKRTFRLGVTVVVKPDDKSPRGQ